MYDLILITGVPGSGKSTVSRAIAQSLQKCVVISGDEIRGLVVGGFKNPAESWTEEHEKQYLLSFENEAALAHNFIKNGFKVIVEDVIHNHHNLFEKWQAYFKHIQFDKYLLSPSKDVLLERNRLRSKNLPESIIHSLYPLMTPDNYKGWNIIDTTDQKIEDTARFIRTQLSW